MTVRGKQGMITPILMAATGSQFGTETLYSHRGHTGVFM